MKCVKVPLIRQTNRTNSNGILISILDEQSCESMDNLVKGIKCEYVTKKHLTVLSKSKS